jgi:hypothetical protein
MSKAADASGEAVLMPTLWANATKPFIKIMNSEKHKFFIKNNKIRDLVKTITIP